MSRSKFPKEIDKFVELYDIPPSLMTKARRYQELKAQPVLNSIEQSELNSLSNELDDYIITPETWNKFADSLVNVQTFFKDKVDGYIDGKQDEWAKYVKNFTFKGVHNENNTYLFQNMVSSSGNLYLALKNVIKGVKITDKSYWQPISVKGDKGDVGLNTHLKGTFSATATYIIGDAVIYQGNIHYCIKNTTAGIAPTNSEYWFLYDQIIVGKSKPLTARQGLSWVELQD